MKIRTGFVSNSSSASFIIQIKDENLLNKIDFPLEKYTKSFSLEKLLRERMVLNTNSINAKIKALSDKKESMFHNSYKGFIEDLQIQNKSIEEFLLCEHTKEEDTIFFLKIFYDVELTIEDDNSTFKLFTPMLNWYTESLPTEIAEMILYYSFEEPEKIKIIEVNHSNDRI